MSWSWLAAALVFSPIVAFFGTFFVLCAIECTALPWFTFYAAPVVLVALWIVSIAAYAYRRRIRRSQNVA